MVIALHSFRALHFFHMKVIALTMTTEETTRSFDHVLFHMITPVSIEYISELRIRPPKKVGTPNGSSYFGKEYIRASEDPPLP